MVIGAEFGGIYGVAAGGVFMGAEIIYDQYTKMVDWLSRNVRIPTTSVNIHKVFSMFH